MNLIDLLAEPGIRITAPPGTSQILKKSVGVSLAEMNALNTTPKLVVPGEAGTILVPLLWMFDDVRGTVGFANTPNISLRYVGVAAPLPIQLMGMIAGATVAPNGRFAIAANLAGAANYDFPGVTKPTGLGLELFASANLGGGNAGSWQVSVAYFKIAGL